jgi:hypothetical protein
VRTIWSRRIGRRDTPTKRKPEALGGWSRGMHHIRAEQVTKRSKLEPPSAPVTSLRHVGLHDRIMDAVTTPSRSAVPTGRIRKCGSQPTLAGGGGGSGSGASSMTNGPTRTIGFRDARYAFRARRRDAQSSWRNCSPPWSLINTPIKSKLYRPIHRPPTPRPLGLYAQKREGEEEPEKQG